MQYSLDSFRIVKDVSDPIHVDMLYIPVGPASIARACEKPAPGFHDANSEAFGCPLGSIPPGADEFVVVKYAKEDGTMPDDFGGNGVVAPVVYRL